MSLNYRNKDELETDLAGEEARHDSNKITDIKSKIEILDMKEEIHKANTQNELNEIFSLKEEKVDMTKRPKILTAQDLEKEKKKATLHQGFSWKLNKRKYEMGATNNIPFIVVKLEKEAYEKLTPDQKKKFKEKQGEKGELLYVSSRGKEEGKEEKKEKGKEESGLYTATEKGKRNFIKTRLDEIIQQGTNEFKELLESIGTIDSESIEKAVTYIQNNDMDNLGILLADFRFDIEKKLFEKYPVIEMDTTQLSEQLKGKRILLYTGAGLSIGGGIPSMSGLQKEMGIKYGEVLSDQFLERFLDSPEKAYAPRNQFTEQSINGKPTAGHYSIKSLANKFGCQILTEDIDLLQRNTGVMEYHTTGDFLRANISEENDLKKIDYIIVAGLSNDDRGLFQRYKDVNPNGKIVAFNMEQPNYLGEEDILVKGDIQKTLPELDKLIQNDTYNERYIKEAA